MRLTQLRLCNFQSFGAEPAEVSLEKFSVLIGPNGSGKTAVLQAISRLFAFDPKLRGVRRSDFHVQADGTVNRSLFIELRFDFPELIDPVSGIGAVPDHFNHMRLAAVGELPSVRYRLIADLDEAGEVEEDLFYVLETNSAGEPVRQITVPRRDKSKIQVHYIPARRNPADHISYGPTALLGRVLRAADWSSEREEVDRIATDISATLLASNEGIDGLRIRLAEKWTALHRGNYFAAPDLSFAGNSLEVILRYLSIGFSPGHGESSVDFTRLSDGQQSLLYLSLVLSVQAINRDVVSGKLKNFDANKLRPPSFSMLVMEEPENSLSPHYLGRIATVLSTFSKNSDSQSIIATHSPAVLKRVQPDCIRYLRLGPSRTTIVKQIRLPPTADAAHKFVRQAVLAYPEIYFARLVILGEGDSEEIVLPQLLRSVDLAEDESSILVTPLGGRHVNHFWRLLSELEIPHITLLDLDLGRFGGGWGRVKYVLNQLIEHGKADPRITSELVEKLPKWNAEQSILEDDRGRVWLKWLEDSHSVFFCAPLDLDFSMLSSFNHAYEVLTGEIAPPDESTVRAVLGKKGMATTHYSDEQARLFTAYHRLFKLSSKPAEHLTALSSLEDSQLAAAMPAVLARMVRATGEAMKGLPE